ncbi:uncharacterized protein LOC104908040 [Beta vulgaris subsp. vulgaris]|uniref:uncharacterized protein LOC104908040 n=1 Tax=Beta vulgaris subsp. vulgaris TaxID=3555 RepID=UPI0005401D5E|nr:uncharacterized protein LOC104908040 [Beta vulgaris subsp. vulgaris]
MTDGPMNHLQMLVGDGNLYICRVKNIFKPAYTGNRWLNGDKAYSIKYGYDWLQGQHEPVPWHYRVWNSLNIFKHSFIYSLDGVLERLKTRDHLFRAGACQQNSCLLCGVGEDSCLHLVFSCTSSSRICQQIMLWLGIKVSSYENVFITWKKWGRWFKSKKLQKVSYAVLAALVYHIWMSRNYTLWNDAVNSQSGL